MPWACSGERYCAVPTTMPVRVSGVASRAWAMPKSVSFDHAVGPDQQVARLDVAVHDAGAVRGGQPVGGLAEHVQRPVDREPALARAGS